MALFISDVRSAIARGWEHVSPRVSRSVRAALEGVLTSRDGGGLNEAQCAALANTTGDDLIGLIAAADLLRKQMLGDTITYVINRNINFTNICFVGCKFCAFSRGPREADAYFLSLEEVGRRTLEARERGATEVCIQGGLPHGLPKFHYRDILRAVKAAVPDMHTHAFSPMEIVYGVDLTGLSLRDYLLMLKDAGLDTLPGTAAEILDDDVRFILSRNKLRTEQWRDVITTAHRCGIPTTSTLMDGHIETPDHWLGQFGLFSE